MMDIENDKLKFPDNRIKLISEYHKHRGLSKEHILSFNDLLTCGIRDIINANNIVFIPSYPWWYFQYISFRIETPKHHFIYGEYYDITPHECRQRNLTYSSRVFADIKYTIGYSVHIAKDVLIGELPMMLKSSLCILNNKNEDELCKLNECPMDPGGYFIIKGVERVVLIQEQKMSNRIFLEKDNNGNYKCIVVSVTTSVKTRTALTMKKNKIVLTNSVFTEDIPLAVIYKAMNVDSDQTITNLVGGDKEVRDRLMQTINHAYIIGVKDHYDAMMYLNKRLKRKDVSKNKKDEFYQLRDVLARMVLSHVSVRKYRFDYKVQYLSEMVRRLIFAECGHIPLDDLDYYGNKRLELAGYLVGMLFEDGFKRMNDELRRTAERLLSRKNTASFDAVMELRHTIVTQTLISSIASGNWVVRRFGVNRVGITQVLSRLSYISCLGMMTKVNSLFEKTRKVSGPRSLQPSQWGMICPCDTPEGEGCGLVKNLALLAHITSASDESPLKSAILGFGCRSLGYNNMNSTLNGFNTTYRVFLNGQLLGIIEDHEYLVTSLRALRRRGHISSFVSISTNIKSRYVLVASDSGRICRPYIIVENGLPKLTQHHMDQIENKQIQFDHLVKCNVIEYLDVNEENDALIACDTKEIQTKTTHIEIACFSILGICAGLIPFPHHNQSPRNTYQCAMGKQAMGTISYNQLQRCDTLMYLLAYPQKPMVKTNTLDLINFDKLPAGQNTIIAVMSFSGYDIEDALIFNKASLDRSYGRCLAYQHYETCVTSYADGSCDELHPPPKEIFQHSKHLMEGLDVDGISSVGRKLVQSSILVRKYTPTSVQTDTIADTNEATHKNANLKYKFITTAYTDRVVLTNSPDEEKMIQITTRETRRPELGDKFSSRHGQKGVIGMIFDQGDMPFTENGICPDIIMNPHGFPSRMTVGKLMELLAGKAGLLKGEFKNGSAFEDPKVEECCKTLEEHGYSYHGKDILISGITGDIISAHIYIGPVYYQKLKHMVADKMHARSTGNVSPLTRQPVEGRSRGGGLRVGEMERDCLVGYGASMLVMERLFYSSDKYTCFICKKCGLLAYDTKCTYCNSNENITKVEMPYACKLLLQELISMNIIPKLHLKQLTE